jgi:hypothetical protein
MMTRCFPAHDTDQGSARPVVRHLDDIHLRHALEELGIEVVGRPDAACVIDLAGPGAGERDQLLHRFDRQGRVHGHHARRPREQRDRGEVLERIERQLAEQAGRGGEIGRGHDHRVAVRRRFRAERRAYGSSRAAAVLDYTCCPRRSVRRRADHARHRVCSAARREGHEEADGLDRVRLREHGARRHCQRAACQDEKTGRASSSCGF